MYFIAVLIMFGLLQYWGSFTAIQKDAWFFGLLEKIQAGTQNNGFMYVLTVLFPCVFLVAILVFIKDWMWGFISLVLAVSVLIYAVGRKAYNTLINDYVAAWKQADYQRFPVILSQLDAEYCAELGEGLQKNHVSARESYIYAAFEGVFVVLFWFVLLGPVGALLYRLNSFFVTKTQWDFARNIHAIMERPAAFLLGLTFVLMGDFDRGMPTWRSSACHMGMSSKNVVHANALAALGLNMDWLEGEFSENHLVEEQAVLAENEINSLIHLVKRSLIFAVFVMAIFQIVI